MFGLGWGGLVTGGRVVSQFSGLSSFLSCGSCGRGCLAGDSWTRQVDRYCTRSVDRTITHYFGGR